MKNNIFWAYFQVARRIPTKTYCAMEAEKMEVAEAAGKRRHNGMDEQITRHGLEHLKSTCKEIVIDGNCVSESVECYKPI